MHRISNLAVLASTLVAVGACKPKDPATGGQAAAPEAGAAAPSEPGAPEIPWDEKSRGQRMEYMGLYVLPRMADVFKGWKADQYAGFKCQTCHGDDMDEIDQQMPNDLFPLQAENTIAASTDYDADVTKFMQEQVVPAMAELMGQEASEPGGDGFNCFSCHPKE